MVFGLGHRSRSRSVRGGREKPGPRSPTCRELTYPAPKSSVASPALDGKHLLLRDAYREHNGNSHPTAPSKLPMQADSVSAIAHSP